jgi:hypothetical protein
MLTAVILIARARRSTVTLPAGGAISIRQMQEPPPSVMP